MASSANPYILLPCQRRFIEDSSQLCLWLATRQAAGKSFALTLKHVIRRLRKPGVSLILSASERQSREDMQKVYSHLRVLEAMNDELFEAEALGKTECRLANGSRIISLPASPDTVRGFTGDVGWDEAAFFKEGRALWRAMYPTITRGYSMDMVSTANGKQNVFYELWEHNAAFAKHLTTIYDAISEGAKVDLQKLRAGVNDPDTWAQEFECRFIDEATALIPFELLDKCEASEPILLDPESWPRGGELYLGMDVGRRRDLTVIWTKEKLGDVYWTRELLTMFRAPFSEQRQELFKRLARVRRACIDASGLGMQIAEEAVQAFGSYRVEPVTFTSSVKEDLAFRVRRLMEDRLLRIPPDSELRSDFHAVQKTTTAAGHFRFDAARSDAGHSDRFWACALALMAGKGEQLVVPNPVTRGRRESIKLTERFNVQRTSWRAGY
ncbi:MAG: terminase family protein [Candidatus Alcyoniella australis]|nr:terminase family protein [Candidatus Alcyoniella australis]